MKFKANYDLLVGIIFLRENVDLPVRHLSTK